MAALAVLILVVVASLAAPLYAKYVSGTDPFRSSLSAKITIDGKKVPVMERSTEGLGLGVTPIGPTWGPRYLLGADSQGRDVAARLLYGGRNSLLIAGSATAICLFLAALVGVTAGFFGDRRHGVVAPARRALGLSGLSAGHLALDRADRPRLTIGPFTIQSNSLLLPILIIGVIYVPYVARPIRGQVMTLKKSEFVLAAMASASARRRILVKDILPNVSTTLIVFVPLMMALNIITESALSFLSIGVQPPDASWGTIIQEGQALLYSRPAVSLAPGIAIVITVLALNVLGDGVRDAFDPAPRSGRGKAR